MQVYFQVTIIQIMDKMYILSQVFVVAYYLSFGLSLLTKNYLKIQILQICCQLFLSGQYFCLSAWTGLVLNVVAIFRAFIYMHLAKRNPTGKPNKLDWLALISISAISVAVTALTWGEFYCVFALLQSLLFTYSTWQRNTRVYKFCGIGISIFGILYSVFIHSVLAIVLESVVLAIDIVNIFRLYVFGVIPKKRNFRVVTHKN